MANTRTIEFKGHFDGKQVLDELKKIRQNMADAGADDNLFKGIDKDIAATEKLVTEMMAQIQKGFSNTKEVNAFEKQIDKLQTNFLKISSGMQNINIAENFGLNSPEINKLTKEIEQLTAAQDHLKEVSKNALDQAQKSIGLRNDEVAEIKKAIDANEDLEEALKKVGKAKEKATLANVGSNAAKTDAGKEYLSKASIGLSLDDLGAKASSGNTAKAKNDARKRYDNGELYGNAGNRELDETKANAAINEVYQKTLEKMITTGGNAAEAIEEMKKALADYGIEIENVDKLQENFYSDIEGFYKSPAVSGGAKSAVTKARKIGQTDAQGNYQLSENSMTNLVNNEEITASSRATQELGQKVQELGEKEKKAQEEGAKAAQKNSESLKDVNEDIENGSKAMKEGAEATKDFAETQQKLNGGFDDIKGAIKTFLSLGSAVNGLRSVFNETFESVKTLDKSFAQIAMVTDYSVQEMWSSYGKYAEMANELGQSTQSVIQASGLFYQQGLETNEALELTEDTMKLATLAGLDFEKATSQMTAALRGFHMEMDEGGRVTDVYSELAAKAAADVQQIAYAMSKTASIASSAGMEFETTSAFLTQMIETTQEAPENIGTAMKTIIARFTELKENVAGTADSEFEDLDYNKVDTALKSVGVSIKDASGQFRDLDDVFLELSQKWNTLDRNSQRYIATIAAGSRQQSRFIAMMENYDRTMELVDTAYNSAGKSSEQFAKYQDTLEYKINKLQNSWEQLRVSLMNSDFFKGVVDTVGNLVGYVSKLNLKEVIINIIGIASALKLVSSILTGIQSGDTLKNFSKQLDKLKGVGGIADDMLKNKKKKTTEEKIKDGGEQAGEIISKKVEESGEKIGNSISEKMETEGVDTAQRIQDAIEEGGKQAAEDMSKAISGEDEDNNIEDTLNNKDITEDIVETGKESINQITETTDEIEEKISSLIEEAINLDKEGNKEAAEEKLSKAIELEEELNNLREQNENKSGAAAIAQEEIEKIEAVRGEQEELEAAERAQQSRSESNTNNSNPDIPEVDPDSPENSDTLGKIFNKLNTALIIAQAIAMVLSIAIPIAKSISGYFEEEEKERTEAYKKNLEVLSEKDNYSMAKTNSAQNDVNTFNDAVEAINTLQGQTFKTAEQEEKLTNAIEYMNSNYPDLVSSYDENTGEIKLLESAVEQNTKALEEQVNAQRIEDLGKMTSGSRAAQDISNYWGKKTGGKFTTLAEKGGEHTAGATVLLGTGGGIAGGLFAGGKIGAGIGSLAGPLGTAIGAAAGAVIGSGIALAFGGVANLIGKNNDTIEETFSDFKELDSETQNKVLEKLQSQGENLQTINDIEQWLEEDTDNQLKLQQLVSDIYQKIATEEHKKETEKAVEDNLLSMEYVNAKGEKVSLDEDIVRGAVTEEDVANVESLTRKIKDLQVLGKNDPWSDVADDWERIKFNVDGAETNGRKFLEGLRGAVADARDKETWELLSWEELSDNQVSNLSYYGITEDSYKELQQMDLTDLYEKGNFLGDADDIYKLVEFARPYLEGFILANNEINEIEYEELQKYTKHYKYEDWTDRIAKAVSGAYTLEDSEEIISAVESEMEAAGMGEDIVSAVRTKFEDINKTWESNKQELNGQLKFSEDVLNQLSGEAIGSLYNLMMNVLSGMDDGLKSQIVMLYNSAFEKIQESDLSAGAKAKVNSYISQMFTPENFDPTLMAQYINDLINLGVDADIASDMVNNFYTALKNHDLLKLNTNLEDTESNFKKIEESVASAESAWDAFVDNLGNWSAEGINSELLKVIAASKELSAAFDIKNFSFNSGASELASEMAAMYTQAAQSARDMAIQERAKGENGDPLLANQYDIESLMYLAKIGEMEKDVTDKYKELYKESEDAKEKYYDALDAEAKAAEDLAKAEKERYEAYHGSDLYMPSVGAGYNYEKQIDRIAKQLDRVNSKLETTTDYQEKIKLLNDEVSTDQDLSLLRLAKINSLESAVADNSKWLAENASEYVTQLEDGSYILNASFYNNPDAPDARMEEILRRVQETEEWMTTIEDEKDQREKEAQARLDREKQRLEDYVSFLEDGADILKTKAEEEVSILEEKYQEMEEADNNYLDALEDAINKQRELRDRENQYEDLATKEKKLSLMRRDTSGANQKEIQDLEKEVEEDRQNLLDEEIDSLIENMKELAEEQAETRNSEIELKNAIIEETNYTKQFAEIASTWTSEEDARAFYLENTDTDDMTTEQIEVAMQSFSDAYNAGSLYMISNQEQINKYTEATAQMVEDKVTEMGNFWTTVSDATTAQVEQDILDTKTEADKNYTEMDKQAKEATQEAKKLKTEWQDASKAAEDARITMSRSIAGIRETIVDEYSKACYSMQKTMYDMLEKTFNEETLKSLGIKPPSTPTINSAGDANKYLGTNYKNQTYQPDTDNTTVTNTFGENSKNAPEKSVLKGDLNKELSQSETDIASIIHNTREYVSPFADPFGVSGKIHPQGLSEMTTYPTDKSIYKLTFTHPVTGDLTTLYAEKNKKIKAWEDNASDYLGSAYSLLNVQRYRFDAFTEQWEKYKTGGLVDYTGPAWVDGTPTKPEAFLNAQDTQRIGEAAKILAQIPALNGASENVSTNIGDTTIEIHINVENIESDYDVDQMIERVKNDIIDVSKPIGTSVILKK